MPSVFTDEVGTYDLAITTSADWTVSSGGMPNGDNYVTGDGSIAATYNTSGTAFDFRDGTAWTVEFWMYYTTARAIDEVIVGNYLNGTTTKAWLAFFQADEKVGFVLDNTVGGSYLYVPSATTLSTSTWYHVVMVKETGNKVKVYLNAVEDASSTTTSGTARTPTSSYYLYFGTGGSLANDITSGTSGLRVSKLAIYNKELSLAEINDHYLAMVAT